jgi:hypothetical protein
MKRYPALLVIKELQIKTTILATQDAEIRRIVVRSQPKQIVHEILSPKGLVEWRTV